MCTLRLSYLMAIVPISVLLTVSFFVLFTLRKIEEKGLRVFGYVVVSFLWLAALIVFSDAVYRTARSSGFNKDAVQKEVMLKEMMQKDMLQKKMKMKMDYSPAMKDKKDSAGMMPEKFPLAKDDKDQKMSQCQGNKGVVFQNE